jgi:hypothetical protein
LGNEFRSTKEVTRQNTNFTKLSNTPLIRQWALICILS